MSSPTGTASQARARSVAETVRSSTALMAKKPKGEDLGCCWHKKMFLHTLSDLETAFMDIYGKY